ncbi:MAG: hypothetical protein DRQ40_06895, partial [Gammaproteobacteria bacterium]
MCVECEITRVRRSQALRHQSEHNTYQRSYNAHNIVHLKRLLFDVEEITFSLRNPKRDKVQRATPNWINKKELRGVYYDCLNMTTRMSFLLE